MAVLVTETLIEIKVKNQYSTFHQINLFRISYSVLAIEALKIFGLLLNYAPMRLPAPIYA